MYQGQQLLQYAVVANSAGLLCKLAIICMHLDLRLSLLLPVMSFFHSDPGLPSVIHTLGVKTVPSPPRKVATFAGVLRDAVFNSAEACLLL